MSKYKDLAGSDVLKTMYPKVNDTFQMIEDDIIDLQDQITTNDSDAKDQLQKHKDSTSDHSTNEIVNMSNLTGENTTQALNNIKGSFDNHVAGTAQKHSAGDITYTGSVLGASSTSEAINLLKQALDAATIGAGTSPVEVATARPGLTGEVNNTLADKLNRIESNIGKITNVSADTVLTADQRGVILVTTGATDRTITLPQAVVPLIARFTIKKADNGVGIVKILPYSGQLIDGQTLKILKAINDSITMVNTGTGWTITSTSEDPNSATATVTMDGINISSLPSYCMFGQLNVNVYGNTRNNLVKSSNMNTDSNSDGVVDDFSYRTQGSVTGNKSLDGSQKLQITASTGGGNAQAYQEINCSAGDIISLRVEAKVGNVAGTFKAYLYYSFLNSSGVELIGGSVNTVNTSFTELKIENLTAPVNTAKISIQCRAVASVAGDIGDAWFKNAMLEKTVSVGSYISSGTKSTESVRLTSTKNLFDNNTQKWEQGNTGSTIGQTIIGTSSTTVLRTRNFKGFRIQQNKTYILSSSTFDKYRIGLRITDESGIILGAISTVVANTTFSTPVNSSYVVYIVTRVDGATINASEISNVIAQIEEGGASTEWAPYASGGQVYTNGALRSLPNGIKDVYNVNDGTVTQNVQKYTLQASDVNAFTTGTNVQWAEIPLSKFTGVIAQTTGNDGSIYYPEKPETTGLVDVNGNANKIITNTTTLYVIYPLGTYADITAARSGMSGTILYYQLAQPITSKIDGYGGTLIGGAGYTVITEPGCNKFEAKPINGVITIPDATKAIYSIESVKLITPQTDGTLKYYTIVPQSNTTTTITLPAGYDDTKMYEVIYFQSPESSTNPKTVITCSINRQAEIESIGKGSAQTNSDLRDLNNFAISQFIALNSAAARSRSFMIPLYDVSATETFIAFISRVDGQLNKCQLATKNAIAASDTDYWTVSLIDKGSDGTSNNTIVSKTTKATGGSGFSAFDMWDAGTLDAVHKVLQAGDVVALTLTKTGNPAAFAKAMLMLEFLPNY